MGGNVRSELGMVVGDMLRIPLARLQDAVPGTSRLGSPEEARDKGIKQC